MTRVAVIARMTAKEGRRAELVEGLKKLVAATESEPGTLVYAMNVSSKEPDVVWFYELYSDQDALRAHGSSDAVKATASLAEFMAGRPELHVLELVADKGLPG
jgi:quinol monooxygenase YgiN